MWIKLASAGLFTGVAGAYAYAANWPTSQIFGRTVLAGRDPRELALTYDDGPNPASTPRLLDLLARFGVRATFFLIGRYVQQQPQLARQIRAAGHMVGNHTMTHPVLLFESPRRVRDELARCNRAIEDATGEAVHLFRPPHGARRPDVLRIGRELGLAPVLWNAMGHDWDAPGPAAIAARVLRDVARNQHRGRGSNILLHDGGHARIGMDRGNTVTATELLLTRWREQREIRCVTVDAWRET